MDAARAIDDVGPQGGDPRTRPPAVRVDLSSCVCRYGPPPAALVALRDLPAAVLRRHPYGADDVLAGAYGAYLHVPADELVVGRGASELIWQLAASELGPRVVVPRPGYTEYQRAFPGAGAGPPGVHHPIELIAAQLHAGRVVLISNPHNPSGRCLDPRTLLAAARAAPRGVLVVDESYVEFAPDPAAASVLPGDERHDLLASVPDNVIVLRSPSKFFGLAGARVGVAWSPSRRLRELLPRAARLMAGLGSGGRAGRGPALADRAWIAATHAALRADACWLGDHLGGFAGLGSVRVVEGSVTHFRLLLVDDAERTANALAAAGLGVRAVGPGHGLAGPALRVGGSRGDERAACAAMLAAFEAFVGE